MKDIKLFDYQEDMKERIEKALRLHRSVMAQMPTGTGKTVLLASVVESFLREHSNCNVWIVAHRRELVSQIRETIQRVFSKTHPQWSLHPLRFPRSRGTETSLTLKGDLSNHPVPLSKEGSTFSPSPSSSGSGDVTAPSRCSEPLRSKDGGPSKVSPDCAGWDRLDAIGASKPSPNCAGWDRLAIEGDNSAGSTTVVTFSASTALVVVQRELKYLGLWKFAGAVMYVLHEALGLSEEKMIAPMDEKRGKLLLAEILNGGNFGRHFTKYGHFTQQGMAKKYFLKIWRNMHFVIYYPAEALSEPIFRTWHFFWRLKHRR